MSIVLSPYNRLDFDAINYIKSVELQDNISLSHKKREAIVQFVINCKRNNIWNSIKSCCILSGANTLQGALVPLKGIAPTNINFTSSDYSVKGLIGDGTTKYLNTNRNGIDDPINNVHLACWVTSPNSLGALGYAYMGMGGGDRANHFGTFQGSLFVRCRENNPAIGLFSDSATGFIGVSRFSSASYGFRAQKQTVILNRNSVGSFDENYTIFGRGNPNSNARIAFYSIGESLNLEIYDSLVSNLIKELTT